jgi:hypothetical protein
MDTVVQVQVFVLRAGMGMVPGREFCLLLRMVRRMDGRPGLRMVRLLFGMADPIRAVRVIHMGAVVVVLMIVG